MIVHSIALALSITQSTNKLILITQLHDQEIAIKHLHSSALTIGFLILIAIPIALTINQVTINKLGNQVTIKK